MNNLACPSAITQNLPGALRALSLDDASQRNLSIADIVLDNGGARLIAWRAQNATTPGTRSSDCSSWKHGNYSAEAKAAIREVRKLLRAYKDLIHRL